MKKALLIIAVLAIVAAGWLIYFSSDTTLTKVSGVQAKKENITIKIELTGEVIPVKSYSVMPTLGGKVSSIHVSEGDTVKKGQKLFSLDESTAITAMVQNGSAGEALPAVSGDSGTNTAIESMMAEEKAKVALALSQTTGIDYESFNEALQARLRGDAALAAATLNSLNATADKTEANQTSSLTGSVYPGSSPMYRFLLGELTQKSIMNGKVLKINVSEGEVLPAGMPAMVVADDSSLKIRCLVNETDLKRFEENFAVNIITRDNVSYSGNISYKSQTAQRVSGGEYPSMEAIGEVIILPRDGFSEIIGSTVDVEIILDEAVNVLCLPLDCITGDSHLFVIKDDNTLEKRKVAKGLTDGYNAQIISGVKEGENIVMSPEGLTDKQKVTVVD